MATARPETEVIDWLQFEAARSTDPSDLLTGWCGRAVAVGVPVDVATLELATLHPLMASLTYEWRRDRPGAFETPRFHDPFSLGGPNLPVAGPGAPPIGGEQGGDRLATRVTFSDGSSHALVFATRRPDGFDAGHRALLERAARVAAAPLEIVALRQMLVTLMTTYLGRRTGQRVLDGAIRRGDGETVNAVLWSSDLRGFTGLSQDHGRDAIIALLNAHFERLVAPIKAFGGEVLKFVGDGLLAIFPIAEAGSAARACTQAIKAVRAARAGMAALNAERRARGEGPLDFGIALHLGDVMYGNIGAPDRLDFTVIGPTVNLASRLEALCKPLACPVVTSTAFAQYCDEPLADLGSHRLAGVDRAVRVHTLAELAPDPARLPSG